MHPPVGANGGIKNSWKRKKKGFFKILPPKFRDFVEKKDKGEKGVVDSELS